MEGKKPQVYLNIDEEVLYCTLMGQELNLNVRNFAKAGNSNDKLFYDLCDNIDNIQDNDIVIYQFSSFDRIGHFHDDNYHSYFSTAGLPQLGIDEKMKDGNYANFKREDLEILIEYIFSWQPLRVKFLFDSPIKILKFLKETKNIKYITTYMVEEFYKIDDNTLVLPIERNQNNVSINDFLMENKVTVHHDFPERYDYPDSHPGVSGHKLLKEMILKKLNTL
jgi:hypothetical protein